MLLLWVLPENDAENWLVSADPCQVPCMRGMVRSPRYMGIVALATLWATGCKDPAGKPPEALSKPDEEVFLPSAIPVPPADGPLLGAVADAVPVLDRPSKTGRRVGALHAGAQVTRSAEPLTTAGCPGGWYPIRPRGVVCIGESATLDLEHPTLVAMSIQPKLDDALPYTYARVAKPTKIFRVDDTRERAVTPGAALSKSSGMAIVGSWEARDDQGEARRLALMTSGTFVPATDLERAEASSFTGVELGSEVSLPVAFIVKRGVHAFALDGQKADKRALLDYHRRVDLTGKYRTIDDDQFWEATDGTWVRHKDVTTVRRRHTFPDFATSQQKWIDVSIITGTLVAYEGHRPVFATLVSVGRDRLGDPKTTQSTAQGEFRVKQKRITSIGGDPSKLADGPMLHDAPWVLELASGQWLHGAYWHDRFGIEHGPGNIQLSPADAQRIWQWSDPPMPEGWHEVAVKDDEPSTIINVRK
jgi:hypothetical protein